MKNSFIDAHIRNDEIIAESKWNFWSSPKIIIAGMTKIIEAVYEPKPVALGVGIYGIYDFKGMNPYCLTAILNSKYLTYYFRIKFKNKHLAGGYLAINKGTIENFPLPEISSSMEDKLADLSQKLHSKTESAENLNDYENQIDFIVYKAFNLEYDTLKAVSYTHLTLPTTPYV